MAGTARASSSGRKIMCRLRNQGFFSGGSSSDTPLEYCCAGPVARLDSIQTWRSERGEERKETSRISVSALILDVPFGPPPICPPRSGRLAESETTCFWFARQL